MRKKLFFVLIQLNLFIFAQSYDETCVDGVCSIPTSEDGETIYSIVSPVGYHDVPMIQQAKRLDSLNNKNIALVGGSFNAFTTFSELKNCFEKFYPTTKIYLLDEVGAAGPYSVYGQSKKTKDFQKN